MPPENPSYPPQTSTASTPKPQSLSADALIFSSGAVAALLLFYVFSSFVLPPTPSLLSPNQLQPSSSDEDPVSFYDDPSLSYSLAPSSPISEWSLDLLARWARLGPQNPDYKHWGEVLRAELPDKLYPDSDDQSALIYLLLKEKDSSLQLLIKTL